MNNLKLTNTLLLIIALPVFVLVLKTLKFIFIPLLFAMFVALLFIPLIRKLKRRGFPKFVGVSVAIILMGVGSVLLYQVLRLSSEEIVSTKDTFFEHAEDKLTQLNKLSTDYLGFNIISVEEDDPEVKKEMVMKYAESFSMFLVGTLPQVLTTLFFVVLLLFESLDFERVLNNTILRKRHASIRTFSRIEKGIVKFVQVKFLVSLGTGVFTGLACYGFDVSFPIFWGFFAFAINFIQMVGSVIAVVLVTIFAFVEMQTGPMLLYFALSVTSVQVIFGSILEPIFMGKSFSINVITVLVSLMFWGYVWGIPGMILSIPITVFIKIILEQFERTQRIARLMQ